MEPVENEKKGLSHATWFGLAMLVSIVITVALWYSGREPIVKPMIVQEPKHVSENDSDVILWVVQQPVEKEPWKRLKEIVNKMTEEEALEYNKKHGVRLTKLLRERVKHKNGWISVFEAPDYGTVGNKSYPQHLAVTTFMLLKSDGDVTVMRNLNWSEF